MNPGRDGMPDLRIGPQDIFFLLPAVLLNIFTLLILPTSSVSLSYFILSVPMRMWGNTHAWVPHFLYPYWMVLDIFALWHQWKMETKSYWTRSVKTVSAWRFTLLLRTLFYFIICVNYLSSCSCLSDWYWFVLNCSWKAEVSFKPPSPIGKVSALVMPFCVCLTLYRVSWRVGRSPGLCRSTSVQLLTGP